jgi:uncharacterized delta-60 repeat protein
MIACSSSGWCRMLGWLVLCLLATAPGASARPGGIDLSFRGTGIAITPVRGSSRAAAIVQQADGKLVAAGSCRGSRHDDAFTLVRYHRDGTLDRSFGRGSGVAIAPSGEAQALVQQTDGKLVAAGSREIGSHHQRAFGITRYRSDGTLDSSFGGGTGTVTTVFGSYAGAFAALVQQADAKLVAAGYRLGGNQQPVLTVVRYNTDGTLDPTFGGGTGTAISTFGDRGAEASALVQQVDGKLVAAGFSSDVNHQTVFAVVRYNADGTLDPSFGEGTGTVTTPFAKSSGIARALVQQADGKLVAAGESTSGGGQARFALVRYNADGTLDPTFGEGTGIVTTLVRGSTNANALVLQPDGKIVAAGYSDTLESIQPFGTSRPKFTLVRYNVDGTIDTTFGRRGSGIVTMPSGSALGLVQQEDGRLVAAGLRFFHNRNVLAVVRYLD